MAATWGLFLCNCRKTLPLDPQKLALPTGPTVLSFATDPDQDFPGFAAAVARERPDRILIACCAEPDIFSKALDAAHGQPAKLHFANLKESCFSAHSETRQAHAKATRLLRVAMESAEAKETPAYNSLKVGGRVVIAGAAPERKQLAEKLRNTAQTIFVVPPDENAATNDEGPGHVLEGTVVEITGRLGDFHVTIENGETPESSRREVKADQIVVISHDGLASFKPRTGCHLLTLPSEDDLRRVAEQIGELTGEFLKPVQVTYNPEVCAGGAANNEACGVCIPACPYDAIGRDPQNHLRVRVDQMACEGCGACVSACPTTALRFTEPSPHELYTKMAALLTRLPEQNGGEALTLLFHCSEQGRRVLEEAGRRPLQYPATVLPVEVPCLRYVSEANMLAAFRLGAAGVGLLGCERCPHGERELLQRKLDFCRVALDAFGLGVERLRLITVDEAAEGDAVAALSVFAETLKPAPIHWDGKPMRHWGNREVIAEAIGSLMDQLGREPGRRPLDSSQPFAFADVKASGCTMCRSCVNVCPTHAFKLDEGTQSLQFKHIACVACGLCEKACPENVIALEREIFFDRGALEYVTIVQDDMVSCANCGKPYINRKALEAVEARLLSLDSLVDTFDGNRRNLLRMCPDCRTVVAMMEVEKGWKP
ncbi:MAG: 4Fe-4S dicluster domain-containing protein [Candidatus Binatia bacterium]